MPRENLPLYQNNEKSYKFVVSNRFKIAEDRTGDVWTECLAKRFRGIYNILTFIAATILKTHYERTDRTIQLFYIWTYELQNALSPTYCIFLKFLFLKYLKALNFMIVWKSSRVASVLIISVLQNFQMIIFEPQNIVQNLSH